MIRRFFSTVEHHGTSGTQSSASSKLFHVESVDQFATRSADQSGKLVRSSDFDEKRLLSPLVLTQTFLT